DILISKFYVQDNYPNEYREIESERRKYMLKNKANSPLNIIKNYVLVFDRDPYTYQFIKNLVDLVLEITKPNTIFGDIYNILSIEKIPDEWFTMAIEKDMNR